MKGVLLTDHQREIAVQEIAIVFDRDAKKHDPHSFPMMDRKIFLDTANSLSDELLMELFKKYTGKVLLQEPANPDIAG